MPPKQRILIIEDDEVVASSLELLLQDNGYEVSVAGSGSQALAFLATSGSFSLILLDYRLPDMSAEDLVEQLPRFGADSVPVILMTGARDPRGKARRLRCVSSLPKPFALGELFSELNNYAVREEAPAVVPE
jgi:CheY-like chemotaxis protein